MSRFARRAVDKGMIVDSYAHVSCRKYRPVEPLLEEMRGAGVDAAVLVQPLGDYDNGYLEEALARHPGRFQAVGLADRGLANLPARVGALLQGGISGLRATPDFLKADGAVEALAAADGVLLTHLPDGIGVHAAELASIAARFPKLRIFIPHLGWPQVNGKATPGWKEGVAALSTYPSISAGISALYYYSQQPAPHKDTWPWIEFLLQTFGPERCMCGSDFPLLLDTGSYGDYSALLFNDSVGVSAAARDMVLGGTAMKFWRF